MNLCVKQHQLHHLKEKQQPYQISTFEGSYDEMINPYSFASILFSFNFFSFSIFGSVLRRSVSEMENACLC